MKNAFQKMILVLLAMALLAGICTMAFAEENAAEGKESISIGRIGSGDVYYGDEVTLMAYVSNVEGDYSIVWERFSSEKGWVKVGTGTSYTFTVTQANANAEIRAMLVISE